MKTAISLPDDLGVCIEAFLQKTQMSRSEFFQRAARAYLDKISAEAITQNLNEVYSQAETREDIAFRRVAIRHVRDLQGPDEW